MTERSAEGTIRLGFVGAGGIAHRHFGVLEQFEDVSIVAVSDTDLARATAAADRFARFGARAFADVADMLDQVPLDAVYICVPPFAHGEPERAALEANLPMFVEKPVGLGLSTAQDIAARVAKQDLVTAVGYHWRYLDTVEQVKAMVSGPSGNPVRLLCGSWLDATPPPPWWWRSDRSGGQMVEQTTHLIDLARHLAGDVVRVYGMTSHLERDAFPELDVPTASTASLQFASGAIGTFASTCLLNWTHQVGLNVFGDGFAVEMTDHDVMIDVGAGRPVRRAEGDPVVQEDRDFLDAVKGGPNRIRVPYAEALDTLRVSLAIAESARRGLPVDLVESAAGDLTGIAAEIVVESAHA